MFLLDNCFNHFTQAINDFLFLFTKRRLIGNLEKVPHCFSPFAVKAADGETDFAYRLNDLVNQFAQDQPGQVQHRGRAHAGADVSRAGG